MTQPQPLDLDAIETRANAATPGPWGFYDGDNYADVAADLQITGRGSYSYREKVARLEDENYWDDPAHEDDADERAPEQMAANAAFIAHAREDVDTMAATIRRLRAEAERRTEDIASADNPTQLRWGLDDVMWGDDDTVTVLLSGPAGEPYWLELDPERAAVLRENLAGPAAVEAHVVADDSNDPADRP